VSVHVTVCSLLYSLAWQRMWDTKYGCCGKHHWRNSCSIYGRHNFFLQNFIGCTGIIYRICFLL